MLKKSYVVMLFCSLVLGSAYAGDNSFFFSPGIGIEGREFDNPAGSKRLGQGGFDFTFDVGYKWKKFELFVHSDFAGGHAEKMRFNDVNDQNISGKFWYGSISAGPVMKYNFTNHQDKSWNFYMMAGPIYKWTRFTSDKASSSTDTYKCDNVNIDYHGMGGVAGIGIARNVGGDVIERMFYQLTYKQVEYRRVKTDWELNGIEGSSRGKSRDFTDRAVAFNVGMTFSDKLFKKVGKASKRVVKLFKD